MDKINLAQDRERWLDAVNAVVKIHVAQNTGNFLTG